MEFAQFQLNKVKRLIQSQGQLFEFKRPSLNEFGEPSGVSSTILIKGVYHETSGFMSRTSIDSTMVRQKPSPMILCLMGDCKKLLYSDTVSFRGKLYQIGEVRDVSESGIVGDISLEEVQKDVPRVQA